VITEQEALDDTCPLPVILPGRAAPGGGPDRSAASPPTPPRRPPAPDPVPAAAPDPGRRRFSGGGQVANDPDAAARAAHAKLEQLKDLYLTAEAIGEDALVRHFDEVSQRQRDLIRDYFKQSGLRPSANMQPADERPTQDGPADERPAGTVPR
jgi:hypothetical protein